MSSIPQTVINTEGAVMKQTSTLLSLNNTLKDELVEGSTEEWNQWESTELDGRKRNWCRGTHKERRDRETGFEDLDCLSVELTGLRLVYSVGLWLDTLGLEFMLPVPRQGNFSRKTALLRLAKCLDEIRLDQKTIYPHLHSNS